MAVPKGDISNQDLDKNKKHKEDEKSRPEYWDEQVTSTPDPEVVNEENVEEDAENVGVIEKDESEEPQPLGSRRARDRS